MLSKSIHWPRLLLLCLTLTAFNRCSDPLEEVPFGQFSPDNFLTTENGLDRLLTSTYAGMQWHQFSNIQVHYLEEGTTDLFFETGGGQNRWAAPLQNWTFDSQHNWVGETFNRFWGTIRDANLFLASVEEVEFRVADKPTRIAEARFIRAFQYYWLTKWFGSVPLLTSPDEELYPTQTPVADIHAFIEAELIAAAADLPVDQPEYGRITRGAALGILAEHYLNTKQWGRVAEVTQEVMELGRYSLFPDYVGLFAADNDRNSEYIFVFPHTRDGGFGNTWMALSRPPRYPTEPNQANFAAQFRYYDAFVESFAPGDTRRNTFLTEYVDLRGDTIQLLGKDDSRSFKYDDPDSDGADQENDWSIIRYADILLMRAEALNELNGPGGEATELVNQVRERAGVEALMAGDYTKESFRDHLLQERAWEFYAEAKRRSDLIRHGKYIQQARDRGIDAEEYRRLYPIPQRELDANPNLVQNPGFGNS